MMFECEQHSVSYPKNGLKLQCLRCKHQHKVCTEIQPISKGYRTVDWYQSTTEGLELMAKAAAEEKESKAKKKAAKKATAPTSSVSSRKRKPPKTSEIVPISDEKAATIVKRKFSCPDIVVQVLRMCIDPCIQKGGDRTASQASFNIVGDVSLAEAPIVLDHLAVLFPDHFDSIRLADPR